MTFEDARARLRLAARRHLLDALDERGLVQGTRLEFPAPGRCVLARFEETQPGPGQVLVETLFTVVSAGTERAVFLKRPGIRASYPYVPGYSQAGRVVAVGAGASFLPGQLVVTSGPHASLVVCDAAQAIPVPDGLSLQQAAAFQMGVVALQGARRAAIQPGETVLVLGAGLIGQISAQAAQRSGARVVLAARSEDRLAHARTLGIQKTVALVGRPDALAGIAADVVLDVTGAPESVQLALSATAPGARVVLVGSTRGASRGLDVANAARRNVTLIGAHVQALPGRDESPTAWTWRHEAETFLKLLSTGALNLAPLLDRVLAPDAAPALYDALARDAERAVGIVLDWSRPGPWQARVERASPLRLLGRGLRRVVGRAIPQTAVFLPARADGRRVRFGLIGCGEIAAANAAAILASSNGAITHAADPHLDLARRLASSCGARADADADAVIESPHVDAVVISTPHHLHAPLALRAANAGKHVIVEKPMATSVADCDAMIEGAKHAGVLLSVCYCQRFDPRVAAARRLVEQGILGDLLGTRISFGQRREQAYYGDPGGVPNWRSRRDTAGGGVLIMNACHILDHMGWIAGSGVVEISAHGATQTHATEVEDAVSASYRYANGGLGSLDATTSLTGPWYFEQALWGTEGRLIVAPELRYWSTRTLAGREAGRWHTIRNLPRAAERRHYFEACAAAILDGTPAPVTGLEAREAQRVISAAYESMARGRAVRLA